MVFSSLTFLFRFLPLVLVAYFVAPRSWRNGVLLVASLLFYAWGEPRYLPVMLLSIGVDFLASNGIARFWERPGMKKLFLGFSLVANLGLLLGFKYVNFILENLARLTGDAFAPLDIALPLGISFFTFQTMSYTIDVYRGTTEAERNLIRFGAYVSLFPQLVAGPIVRYADIAEGLRSHRPDPQQISLGIRQFIQGLAAKVLLANPLGMLWEDVRQRGFSEASMPMAWLGILAFALQIYFDFSGYSRMAIGLGNLFGLSFPENFNHPYASRSVTEFWRRWHMTLGQWFRSYVYIPLGGNRRGPLRQLLNLLVVWFLTGLWHGASWNFVLWGLWFGVFLAIEKFVLRSWLENHAVGSHAYTILVVLLGWVLFAIPSLADVGMYLQRLFSFRLGTDALYALRNHGVLLLLGVFLSLPPSVFGHAFQRIGCRLFSSLRQTGRHSTRLAQWRRNGVLAGAGIAHLGLFLLSVAYLVDAGFNPFLYFRF